MSSPHRTAWAAVLLAGCASAYHSALRRAEDARARGALHEAAAEYRRACTADPGYKQTCATAAALERELVAAAVAAARGDCEAGRSAPCREKLTPALRLAPRDPQANGLLEAAARVHLDGARMPCLEGLVDECRHMLEQARLATPDDPKIEEMLRMSGRLQLEQATEPCAQGEVDACLDALAAARKSGADEASLAQALEALARARADKCAGGPLASLEQIFATLRCVSHRADELRTPVWTERAAELRSWAATALADLARSDAYKGPGAVWALRQAQACLDPDPAILGARDAARQVFNSASALRLVVEGATTGSPPGLVPGLCERTAALLGEGVRCVGRSELREPGVSAAVRIELGQPKYAVAEQPKTVRFERGQRDVPNPAFAEVERRWRDADAQVRRLEAPAKEAAAECERAEAALVRAARCQNCAPRARAQQACGAVQAAKAQLDAALAVRESARQAMERTPSTVKAADHAETRFLVRHHTWTARYRINQSLDPSRDGEWQTTEGVAKWEDDENPSIAEAGVPADPRKDPPAGHFLLQAADAAARTVADAVRARSRASDSGAARCSGAAWSGPWLQCRAEQALWSGTLPDENAALTWVARLAVTDAEQIRCR